MSISKKQVLVNKFKLHLVQCKPNKSCVSCKKLLYKTDIIVIDIHYLDLFCQNKIEISLCNYDINFLSMAIAYSFESFNFCFICSTFYKKGKLYNVFNISEEIPEVIKCYKQL